LFVFMGPACAGMTMESDAGAGAILRGAAEGPGGERAKIAR
jgi:hypothetical protein